MSLNSLIETVGALEEDEKLKKLILFCWNHGLIEDFYRYHFGEKPVSPEDMTVAACLLGARFAKLKTYEKIKDFINRFATSGSYVVDIRAKMELASIFGKKPRWW